MHESLPAYGLWPMVIINSAVFIIFAYSFTKPKTKPDWRSLGAFSAFIVALFVEMYGFPLTIFFLSGWLQSTFPQTDILSHANGHLWQTLFGFEGDPHLNPIHLLSNGLIAAGFYIVYKAWQVLHAAQQQGKLAITGSYAIVRASAIRWFLARNGWIPFHVANAFNPDHVSDSADRLLPLGQTGRAVGAR